MFDFRRITLFCLKKRLSKHKMTIFSKTFGGVAWPFWPTLSTPTFATNVVQSHWQLRCTLGGLNVEYGVRWNQNQTQWFHSRRLQQPCWNVPPKTSMGRDQPPLVLATDGAISTCTKGVWSGSIRGLRMRRQGTNCRSYCPGVSQHSTS